MCTDVESTNAKGHLAGMWWNDAWERHVFVKMGSDFAPIYFPGSLAGNLLGINNADQMVGWYADADWLMHGFLVEKKK